MRKWALVLMVMLGIGFGAAASAGNWSIGYSDYGRHGGYNLTVGSHGYRSFSAFTYAPSWGYGYRDSWRDPWYLSSYRAPVRSYYGCDYGCAPVRSYGYATPRYYGSGYGYRSYGYRPSYNYRPHYSYRSHNRDYGRRYDRYDNRSYNYSNHRNHRGSYARHDRYDGYRRGESAHQRVRQHTYYGR